MSSFQTIQTVGNQQWPCPRWGHALLTVQSQIFLFGGYQNSKYYNDLWRFDPNSLAFHKVEQFGELPPPCSNFTLNYYQRNNVMVLFGGGTLNKEKLNAVYLLNMATFAWSRLAFPESMTLPWQRSYHCAQIIGHYLVIHGGEFFHDLDDTWILDLHTHQWMEVKLQKSIKPAARKFASSFVYNQRMYIVGGCAGKYECIDDCFMMDFSGFLASGEMKLLQWKEVQLQSRELINRWGHISIAKGSKAYLLGGRKDNKDLQNLVEIDLMSNRCKAVDIKGEAMKGRRKPGVCIRNNTLFCFSGFDGNYAKDFIYVSLPINLDWFQIKEDTEGKQELERILMPDNVEEDQVNLNEEVLYVTEEEFQKIEESLRGHRKGEVHFFEAVGYRISKAKLRAKSGFFRHFLSTTYSPEHFSLHCLCPSAQESSILLKMLLSFLQFGKVIVPRCQFANSRIYFTYLLQVSEYYCCEQLTQVCKRQLLHFFTDEIVPQKANPDTIIQMCEIMAGINVQYESYAGYFTLSKLIERHRGSITSMSELRQFIANGKEYKPRKEWMLRMADQFSFELTQAIVKNKEVNFENINWMNVPKKGEKSRKGSMHYQHTNK